MRTIDELRRLHARAEVKRREARQLGRAWRRVCRLARRVGAVPPEEPAELVERRMRIERQAEWAQERAQSIAMPRAALCATCRQRWRTVRCGCGSREIPVGCDQVQLCDWCRARHMRKWRRRITRAMGAHLMAAVRAWEAGGRRGYKPGIYLITLHGPHSGSIATDRERLGRAWRALTKRATVIEAKPERLDARGRRLRARAGRPGWWGAYALTWEVTPGTRGDGHVHAHVAVISSWIPYAEVGAAWREIVPGAVQPEIVSPKEARERAQRRGRSYKGPESAAYYLSKYVTKGVDPGDFTGQKAGEMLVGFRGKRRFTTSRWFWRPARDREVTCRKCHKRTELAKLPPGLMRVAPAAVLRAFAERVGWWVARGAVQVQLL